MNRRTSEATFLGSVLLIPMGVHTVAVVGSRTPPSSHRAEIYEKDSAVCSVYRAVFEKEHMVPVLPSSVLDPAQRIGEEEYIHYTGGLPEDVRKTLHKRGYL